MLIDVLDAKDVASPDIQLAIALGLPCNPAFDVVLERDLVERVEIRAIGRANSVEVAELSATPLRSPIVAVAAYQPVRRCPDGVAPRIAGINLSPEDGVALLPSAIPIAAFEPSARLRQ